MPPPKAEEALRKRKEAKQKILLIALAPVLLGLLAWQGPKTYKSLTAGAATPPPPPVTTTTTPTTTTPAGPTPTPTGSPTNPTGLIDSDPLLTPGLGQLVVFNRFVGKDPFRAKPTISVGGDSDQPTGAATSASLEVNGVTEDVKVGETFPASDGAFRLVAVGEDTAQIGLASGTFSNGQETMTLKIGESLVLISEPDGTRYAIKLVSIS
jgi:hypothetical protein